MSVSLARSTLKYEWKRYLAAVAALAFSGLLMLIQVGLLFGMFATFTTVVSRSPAPLWVTAPNVQSFDMSFTVPDRYIGRFLVHPDVTDVQILTTGFGEWLSASGTKMNVSMYGLNTKPNSLTLMKGFAPAVLAALAEPNTVVVDRADAAKLGAKIGGFAEINKKRMRIVGFVDGFRTTYGAYAFVSQPTMRLISGETTETNPPYFLIGLRQGADASKVCAQLTPRDINPGYSIWTREELTKISEYYWIGQSGSGASFAFSGLIAFLVGIGITSQTLRAAILANMREYAALRALGIGVDKLRKVVVEQSFWVGITGVIACYFFTILLSLAGHYFGVALSYPWWTIVITSVFVLFIALASGMLSLKSLYKSEPAELLR